jgi:hypothetical protein
VWRAGVASGGQVRGREWVLLPMLYFCVVGQECVARMGLLLEAFFGRYSDILDPF